MLYFSDMGEIGGRVCVRQAKLGYADCLCILHYLPGTNAAGKCTTMEVPLLQKATNTHPFPVDSCEC